MNQRAAGAAGIAVVLLLGGCSAEAEVAAGCDPVERPQVQEGSHLLGDQAPPVPYSSVPPTSGWHRSGRPPDPGAYVEPLPDPALVSVLEQGGVVVAHQPDLSDAVVGALQRLPAEVDDVVVTPHDRLPSPITLTAWGVLQRCDEVTAQDVAAFRDEHARGEGH